MPTYAMLTTLGPDGWATVRENPERIRQVTREVEGMGLKVIAQYALMGQYDFLNVIESPDEATMARAAIMLAARGTMRTTTLQAISVEELIESLKSDGLAGRDYRSTTSSASSPRAPRRRRTAQGGPSRRSGASACSARVALVDDLGDLEPTCPPVVEA